MRVLAGSSGYSYKQWKGPFYPADLPADQMLRYYGERLPTVEINNTFYRMPARAVLERWAQDTPEGFVFALKSPGRITHQKRLGDVGDALAYFLETSGVLQAKRGPVLYQLPPYLRKDLDRLRRFLERLPPDSRAAIEFRHASWFDDEAVFELLREKRAALCLSEMAESEEGEEVAPAPLVPTTDWGYLRLRRADYDEAALQAWADRIRAQPWREAFVFFKHEDEGAAPAMAARLQALASG